MAEVDSDSADFSSPPPLPPRSHNLIHRHVASRQSSGDSSAAPATCPFGFSSGRAAATPFDAEPECPFGNFIVSSVSDYGRLLDWLVTGFLSVALNRNAKRRNIFLVIVAVVVYAYWFVYSSYSHLHYGKS